MDGEGADGSVESSQPKTGSFYLLDEVWAFPFWFQFRGPVDLEETLVHEHLITDRQSSCLFDVLVCFFALSCLGVLNKFVSISSDLFYVSYFTRDKIPHSFFPCTRNFYFKTELNCLIT